MSRKRSLIFVSLYHARITTEMMSFAVDYWIENLAETYPIRSSIDTFFYFAMYSSTSLRISDFIVADCILWYIFFQFYVIFLKSASLITKKSLSSDCIYYGIGSMHLCNLYDLSIEIFITPFCFESHLASLFSFKSLQVYLGSLLCSFLNFSH